MLDDMQPMTIEHEGTVNEMLGLFVSWAGALIAAR